MTSGILYKNGIYIASPDPIAGSAGLMINNDLKVIADALSTFGTSGFSGYSGKSGFSGVAGYTRVLLPCQVSTTADLGAHYSAGTITNTVNGALIVDGYSAAIGDRILVKNQSNPLENGIYAVQISGSAGAAWSIYRTSDFVNGGTVPAGANTFVINGTIGANTVWEPELLPLIARL
jgi:hypothetical protein